MKGSITDRTYGRVAGPTNNLGPACVASPDVYSGAASVIAAGYSIEDQNLWAAFNIVCGSLTLRAWAQVRRLHYRVLIYFVAYELICRVYWRHGFYCPSSVAGYQ